MAKKTSEEQTIVALAMARHGFTQREIAETTGLPQTTVSTLARRAGIRRRRSSPRVASVPDLQREAIVACLKAGEPQAEIAKRLGYAQTTISRIGIAAGLRTRKKRQQAPRLAKR